MIGIESVRFKVPDASGAWVRRLSTFDLTAVSNLQYRNKLRLARYVGAAIAAMIVAAIVSRLLLFGLDPALLVGYVFALGAAAFGVFAAVYYAAPGPTELRISAESILFSYRGGRVVLIDTTGPKFRLRLAEVVPPERRPWSGLIADAPCFAVIGWRWLPLTQEAYSAIINALRSSGISERSSFRPNPPAGGFRVSDFYRRSS